MGEGSWSIEEEVVLEKLRLGLWGDEAESDGPSWSMSWSG